MATPKMPPKKKGGSSIAKGLLSEAAGEDMGDAEESAEPEYDPGEEHKEAFLEMCRAIRDGDDEAAFAAYKECQELG